MTFLSKFRSFVISRSRSQKTLIFLISDLVSFNAPFCIALIGYEVFSIENYGFYSNLFFDGGFSTTIIIFINFISFTLIFLLNGYKSFFRSSSYMFLFGWARLVGLFSFFTFLIFFIFVKTNSIFEALNFSFMHLCIVISFLVFIRSQGYYFLSQNNDHNQIPILIYGAGQAGRETAASLSQNNKYRILGFIDDDERLKNFEILGIKVLGNLQKISKIKKNYENLLVIMALVNIKTSERHKIINLIEKFEVQVKTIPLNYGSLETKLSIQDLSFKDLINRDDSQSNFSNEGENIKGKNILISGAGGSIGSEISLQVANLKPNKIILIDNSEINLYRLEQEFQSLKIFDRSKFILRDIQNTSEVEKIIKKEKINTIFHAAAYKHVPMLEENHNIEMAIKNNFIATLDLCEIASKHQVNRFVLISTDKAVNPTNIMGASKRLAELSLQALQDKKNNETCFSMVRFGNVLNSSGSVVPLFWTQISQGGPVSVTHKEINRFFMTIEEASMLVIQSNEIAEGGEVFLLDMGNPIKIKDLAEKMIRLSGNSVAVDGRDGIKIEFSGLRPGEKLYEELLLNKNPISTIHPKIKKAMEKKYDFEEIKNLKKEIIEAMHTNDSKKFNYLISKYVDGYKKVI